MFRVVISAVLALAASAAADVTVGRNEAILRDDDARLEQKVTFDAGGLTVADVLAKLAQQTGVVLNAGQDEKDWTVSDRKLIIHVKDMPLRDVMQEIAGVLRFHWSRGGESGKWTYRLWQDKRQKDEEESLRTTAENAQSREYREKRENALSDLVNLGSLGQADVAALKQNDPWRYVLATQPLGSDVMEFMQSCPEARSAFITGAQASFPVAALPANLQSTVRRIADSYDSLARSVGVSDDHAELLSRFDKLQITINRPVGGSGEDILSKSLLGRITIGSGTDTFDIPLFDPSSALGKALGTAIVRLQAGTPKEQVAKELQSAMEEAARTATTPAGPARDISSDPALRAKVRLFEVATIAPLTMTLQSLARSSKLNVVSDYFPGVARSIPSGEKPLGEQLEIIRSTYGSNWEKAGSMVRFRDEQWFAKRAREVPQAWIDYWIARAKLNEGLLLDDLVQIGNLRDEQLDHTVAAHPQLAGYGAAEAVHNRHILRFYASLSAEQKKVLLGTGLAVSNLDESQWTALQTALATKGAAYAAAQKGSQTVRFSQTGRDIIEYTFAYYPAAGEPAVTFKLTSGVIYRPAEESPIPAKPPR